MKSDISIDKNAVSRAVRAPLEAYYKEVEKTGYDGFTERPGTWEENEALCQAIFKSRYVRKHLDWLYALELIYYVLDNNAWMKANDFAEKLEDLIIATADERDYLAIFPLSFDPALISHLPGVPKFKVRRRKSIGTFTISPPTPTVGALNKLTARDGFPNLEESDFQHAMRMSNHAFARDMLVTFQVHGAEDHVRWKADQAFTLFRRLIELFGALFTSTRSGFLPGKTVNHFFLLNKTYRELRRLPTRAPSHVSLPLDASMSQAIGKASFKKFLVNISSSTEGMYGRLKNAIKFFSMALNAEDNVSSFLFYVISMESIFSRDKNNPIKVTLADLGAMLCFPPEQRLIGHQRIREAYDLRSAIVHNGASFVSRNNLNVTKLLAARAIYGCLFLCDKLAESGQGKLEDRFFNHLRDQKLGLVKSLRPRELWTLPEIADLEDE